MGPVYPPAPRPPLLERAWWWLPSDERRARRERRRAWERYKAQQKKQKDKDNDCCDALDCADGCTDPCLIALIPVVFTSGLRAVLTAHRGPRLPGGRASAFLHGSVEHYRTRISPARAACCPYTPSCSTYAVQALHRHGALRATRLTAGRLLRCRPGTRGGSDPVPE
ncbi:membrane protein insertion efficiency factor YidD [Kitasatospora sp. NPDC004289]